MEEGASPPRWALDKKLGEDASMEEKKEGEKEGGGARNWRKKKGDVERLLNAKFIQTIRYANWISNVVPIIEKMVKCMFA